MPPRRGGGPWRGLDAARRGGMGAAEGAVARAAGVRPCTEHITSRTRAEPHKLTPFAVPHGRRVLSPSPPEAKALSPP
ncbi:hypothetical protein [Archangium sp.]|uniref:hypothetical protein n=1 Tax=Archangium sp. TaxID=1872627 RepID=UPI00286C6282|nr:hypothetical protein [Archangium sp.]